MVWRRESQVTGVISRLNRCNIEDQFGALIACTPLGQFAGQNAPSTYQSFELRTHKRIIGIEGLEHSDAFHCAFELVGRVGQCADRSG